MIIVSIGCSSDRDYQSLLPLTALLWRDLIGFSPFLILAGDNWTHEHPRSSVTLDALQHHKFSYVLMPSDPQIADAQLAQNSRQHIASLCEILDTDWILPSDADLWPLKKEFYKPIGQPPAHMKVKAVCAFSNGDHFAGKHVTLERIKAGKRFQTLPTCHVAMHAKTWREIYGITPGDDILGNVKRTIAEWFARFPQDGFNTWMSDQDIMTAKLCEQSWFPAGVPGSDVGIHHNGEVLFIPRRGHPPMDRLDRGHLNDWLTTADTVGRWTDAHMHRDPFCDKHWSQTLPLIDALIPQHSDWARQYREEYVKAS